MFANEGISAIVSGETYLRRLSAEYERELAKERTALKREASRASGTQFGRPRKIQDKQDIATARWRKEEGHSVKQIAKFLGVSRATLYRYLTDEAA